jgi:hypothetical protein
MAAIWRSACCCSWVGCWEVSLQRVVFPRQSTLCYDFLEEEHGGWENNDGEFGEFLLDVLKRTVELEFHGRFTDVSTSHHSF